MNKGSIILKQDTRGRVRTPVDPRKTLVAEVERSGLSAMRFAALAGVRYNTFWNWLKNHGVQPGRSRSKAGHKPKFVEVVMEKPSPCPIHDQLALPLLVTLPGEAGLSLSHPSQVPLAVQLIQAMLSFTGSLQVFVALDPIDMRKGFEGLSGAVSEKLKVDLCSGALFVFTNKKRTLLKVLYWDRR